MQPSTQYACLHTGPLPWLQGACHAAGRVDIMTNDCGDIHSGVRALLLGERLETRGLERDDTIWTTPLTLRLGEDRIAVLFRYGVAVFAGMSPIEKD